MTKNFKRNLLYALLFIWAMGLPAFLVVHYVFAYPDYTVVTSDGYDNQAGDIILTPDGDFLIAYRKGVSDGSDKGKIVSRRKPVFAKTWQPEVLIYEHPTLDVQVPMMTVLDTGEILITFWLFDYQTGAGIPDGVVVAHSNDDGHNWVDFDNVDSNFTQECYGSGKIIETSSGDILIPLFGKDIGDTYWSSSVMRSPDGYTWGGEVTIAQSSVRYYAEPNIAEIGEGRILALLRSDTEAPWSIYGAESLDNGYTWGEATQRFIGNGRPTFIQLSDGRLVTIYRRYIRPEYWLQFPVLRVSTNGGITWSEEIVVDDTNYAVYGSLVEIMDRVAAVYFVKTEHETGSIVDVRFKYITNLIDSIVSASSPPVSPPVSESIGVSVYRTSNVLVPSSEWQFIPFGHEYYDLDDMHNGTDSKIDINESGYYMISAMVRWQKNALGYRQVFVVLNGTKNILTEISPPVTSEITIQNVARTIYLNAGDYLELCVTQTSGQSIYTDYSPGVAPIFNVHMIGR